MWETDRNVLLSSCRIEGVITFSSCLAMQDDANKDFIKSNMANKCVLRNHHWEGEVSQGQHYQHWDGGTQAPHSWLQGSAPSPVRESPLPQPPQNSVCWGLGCARNPAGTVPLGHIVGSSGTVLLTTPGFELILVCFSASDEAECGRNWYFSQEKIWKSCSCFREA